MEFGVTARIAGDGVGVGGGVAVGCGFAVGCGLGVWFYFWMGEGDPDLDWDDGRDGDGPIVYTATSLVTMFEKSWRVISSALDRWTSADLEQLFPAPESHQAWLRAQGLEEESPHTRQWIVWHVLEHEIHHGGELSLALGTHGLDGFYNW